MYMNKKGFTLIELLVVIAIIGILSGFVAVQMNNAANVTKDTKRKADIELIKNALISYRAENYSSTPVEDCKIEECVNLPTSLVPFLGSLPTDPNASESYRYSSDGTNCSLYATLSDGSVYNYSCATNKISSLLPESGSCGTAGGSNSYTAPSTNLCSEGDPSEVTGTGPWNWTCSGSYGGVSASCVANLSVNATCGDSNGANLSSIPTTNLCNQGNPTAVTGSGPWNWNCEGLYGGTTLACATGGVPVNGDCGSSNNANLSSIPLTNLCNQGNPTAVTGAGPWNWNCEGLYGGTTLACATGGVPVNGACGLAAKAYAYTDTAYAGAYCTTGTQSSSPDFPLAGGSSTWTCIGAYTGTNSGTCTATRATAPVYTCGSSTHSEADCTAIGGTLVVSGECKICKFSGASCPSGWSPYLSWTTIPSKTCYNGYDMNMCTWECVYPSCDPNTIVYYFGLACGYSGHGFSNNSTVKNRCYYGHCGLWADCYGTVTEIGCF